MDHFANPSRRLTLPVFWLFVVLFATTEPARADDGALLTTPPAKPLRLPAEFEPMQAVIHYPGIELTNLYRNLTEDVRLIVPWRTNSEYESARRSLVETGANLDNCEFYQVAYRTMERDGMPWFLFTDHNEPAFVYNQRETDSWPLPQYGLAQGYHVYRSGLSVEGGHFITDGQGTAVSLDNVAFDHADMGDEFMQRVRDFWGIHTYHFIANAGGSYEYMHIDCLAKFLTPDTIMVARVPSSFTLYERTENAAAYFRRQVSYYGTAYRVVRVDAPNREPYINSLIVNRRIYVPIMGRDPDAAALASYEAAMPGYEVIGVRYGPEGVKSAWSPFIALHCITMGIADEQMLYIQHVPLLDRPPTAHGFPIAAKIVAHSCTPFIEDTPAVLWRALADANETQPPAPWNAIPMAPTPELGDHQHLAHIPAQPTGTVIQYYLQARDASGRNEAHPYIGAPQAHTFMVTTLGANVSAVSAQRGGTIEIYMNAGLDNAQQDYRLTYSLCADPNLPEGLPVALPDTTVLAGFDGTLDDFGTGIAQMILAEPLTSDWVGRFFRFSLELDNQQSTVPDTVRVQILE